MSKHAEIHLGFELGSGAAVSVPIRHMAVTGQTQESGKTTTLEALITRSGLRAITFITKRGESAFQDAALIEPYFRERADWQYVSAILEATLREKMKFERSWIMKVCKGAETLSDVQANITRGLEKAKGLNESVLTTLHAYLEIVIPQIEETRFAKGIVLAPGVNAMDLSSFSLELQSLIIRSAIEWVYEREVETIVLIPEAWEFIPQSRSSPVKLACEQLIRKGAALRNYVWLDSQDIAAVHKDILRSVSLWILGVQREKNEVARTLAHVGGSAKPSVRDVMELGVGDFFVCRGRTAPRVYVQPKWMTEHDAKAHAMGGPIPAAPAPVIRAGKDKREIEEMEWKRKYEKLEAEMRELQRKHTELLELPGGSSGREYVASSASVPAAVGLAGVVDIDQVYEVIAKRLRADPALLRIALSKPAIDIVVQQNIIKVDGDSLRGRLGLLVHGGFFDSPIKAYAAWKELCRTGGDPGKANLYKACDDFQKLGFLTKEGDGYRAVESVMKNLKITTGAH